MGSSGINIQNDDRALYQCVHSDYVSKNTNKSHKGGSDTTACITSNNTTATLSIVGSLNIEADMAKMASISGSAHVDYHDSNKEESLVRTFSSKVLTTEFRLDYSTLKPEDFIS